jgi:hypothetical protein
MVLTVFNHLTHSLQAVGPFPGGGLGFSRGNINALLFTLAKTSACPSQGSCSGFSPLQVLQSLSRLFILLLNVMS